MKTGQLYYNQTGLVSHNKYKINSKWTKDLNLRPKTIKLSEVKIGSMLFDIGLTNSLDMSPQARAIKAKTSKWGCTKLMSFYMEEKNSQQSKKAAY